MTNDERVKCVQQIKYVDIVIKDAPWIITKEFIEYHKIDICAYHDSGIYNSGIDGHIIPKQMDIFYHIDYTHDISTTMIIQRILDNYEKYANRNKNKI